MSNSLTGNVDIILGGRPGDVLKSSPETPSNIIFMGSGYKLELKGLYDALLPTAKFHSIMDLVRKNVGYLIDIRTVSDEMFVYLREGYEPIPLSYMGDGFREVLRLAFISALTHEGIAVLEEPENRLHPGFMDLAATRLVKAAQEGTQLFIATHSLEFLKFLLEKAKKEDTRIIRMYWADGVIDYEVMNGEEALEESNQIGLDLRGI